MFVVAQAYFDKAGAISLGTNLSLRMIKTILLRADVDRTKELSYSVTYVHSIDISRITSFQRIRLFSYVCLFYRH